ncbi:hypothetical protein skT53_14650 [Effusibacillus dendaii]|uniref:DNA (cytosine-5-)-methyltransferase n=1 Tax=Effusibacillus dendaii TaxID=2743772 RepID=A0A7I8DD78_9BACL|nr:hypothetical protein skT53_14650 [Effusibacillus dendaii]
MFRIIQEIRPSWVLGENVAGHISLGLDDVLSDLESIGYEAQAFVIPACAVNAPHRRDRVWIVAYSNSKLWKEYNVTAVSKELGFSSWGDFAKIFPNSYGESGLQAYSTISTVGSERNTWNDASRGDWRSIPGTYWDVFESPIFGVVDGLPDHMDRVAALGNAVVPQQVYPILKAIAEIQKGMEEIA